MSRTTPSRALLSPTSRRPGVLVRASALGILAAALAAAAQAPLLTRTDVSAGPGPTGVVVADFDGDGDQDIATLDRTLKIVKIRRNSGDGVTYSNQSVSLVGVPDDLALGRFDGNAFPDLAIVGGGDIEVLLNAGTNGGATLQLTLRTPISTPGFDYTAVTTLDLDKDGDDDIAAAYDDPAQNGASLGGHVDLYKGDGAGAHTFDVGVDCGSNASDLAAGDIDADTWPDLVASSATDKGLYYFRNSATGNGRLAAAEFDRGIGSPLRLAIGDITGDGRPDVVATGYENRGTYITLVADVFRNLGGANHESGQPSGRFWHEYGRTVVSQISPIPATPLPPGVAIADMNADGRLDVAITSPETDFLFIQAYTTVTSGSTFIALNPDGQFAYDTPDAGADVAAARLDAGTSLDAVVLSGAGTMAVFLGEAGGGGGGGGGGTVDPPPGAPPASTSFTVKPPKLLQDGQKWRFNAVQQAPFVTGVRVQSSATPGDESSWRDLPVGAILKNNGRGTWKGTATDVTEREGTNTLSFRTVSTAPGRPETPSAASASYLVAPRAPAIDIKLSAVTSSDSTGYSVSPGEGFIYTVRVRNKGDAPLAGAVLDASVPASLSLLTATEPFTSIPGRGLLAPTTVRWDLGTIAPGTTVERSYVAGLDESSEAILVVTPAAQMRVGKATVKSKSLIAAVRGILSVQVEPRADSVGAGELLGYTITVRNNSFDTIGDVVVTDRLPAGMIRENAWFLDDLGRITASPVPNPDGGLNPEYRPDVPVGKSLVNEMRWYVGPMAARTSRTLLLEVRAPFDLPSSGIVENLAYQATGRTPSGTAVKAFRGASPPVVTEIAARATAPAPSIELRQYAVTDRGATAGRGGTTVPIALHGEEITYSVAWRNAGQTGMRGALLLGTFPPGTDLVPGSFFIDGVAAAQDPRVRISSTGWVVDLGSFEPGPFGALFYVARVRNATASGAPKAGSAVVSTARIVSGSYRATIVAEPENLAVIIPKTLEFGVTTKRALRSRAAVGETHRYVHTLHNGGAAGAANVVGTGQVPGMTVVGAKVRGSNAGFTQTGDKVVIPVGAVTANEVLEVTLDCRLDVAPPPGRQVIHVMKFTGVAQGTKAPAGASATSAEAMDCDGPDCSTVFVGTVAPYYATTGEEYTYTVFWGNATDVVARNVVVRAQVSSDIRVVAGGIGDGGTQKGSVITWRVGDVPAHWGGAVTLRAVVEKDVWSGGTCFVTQRAWVTSSNAPSKGSGSVATNVRDGFFASSFLQSGACVIGAFGFAVQGGGTFALDTALAGLDGSSQSIRVGSADTITTSNGVVTVPLRGGRVIALGRGTAISTADASALQRATTGPNVCIVGDAAQIQVTGILCTGTVTLAEALERALEIVACKEASVFSVGGGNVIDARGTGLLPNGLAGQLQLAGRIQGLDTLTTRGGGLLSLDGGSLVGNDGASLVGQDGSTLVGLDGGTLVGLDGGSLIGADGSTLVGQDGSTLIGADGSTLVGQDGSTLVGQDGSTLVGNDGASKR